MKLSVLSSSFIEDVKKMIEKNLNFSYSWAVKGYVPNEGPYTTVTEILDFEDETFYGGYCETCAYEDVYCYITYKTADNITARYEYTGSFAELINSLVED